MFWTLVAIELEKIVKRSLFLFFLGLLVGLLLLAFLGGLFAFELTGDPDLKVIFKETLAGAAGVEFALSFVSNLGGFALLILTAAIATSEYQWRTLHLYLSRGIGRGMLLGAKLTALAAIALFSILVALAIGLLLGLPLVIPMGGAIDFTAIGVAFLRVPRIFLALLPFIAIAFPIAILTRSIAATNAITLLYITIVENVLAIVGRIFGEPFFHLTRYLPFKLAQSVTTRVPANLPEARVEEFMKVFVAPNLAAFGVIVWVILLISLAWFLFRQQDLTS